MKERDKNIKQIFLLEDDPDIRKATAFILKRTKEFTVITGSNVAEANFRLKNQKFDCILLDYQLGNFENSEKVLDDLRLKHSFNEFTPVILMTESFDKNLISKVKRKINSALMKPISHSDLIERVKKLTSQ